jgi:hypothetical protein
VKVLDVGLTSCGGASHSVLSEARLLLLDRGLRLLSGRMPRAPAADFPRLLLLMLRVGSRLLHREALALRCAGPIAFGACSRPGGLTGSSGLCRLRLNVNIVLDVEFVVHFDDVYLESVGALALAAAPLRRLRIFILTLRKELLLTRGGPLPIHLLGVWRLLSHLRRLLLATRRRGHLMGRIGCNIHFLSLFLQILLLLLLLLQLQSLLDDLILKNHELLLLLTTLASWFDLDGSRKHHVLLLLLGG